MILPEKEPEASQGATLVGPGFFFCFFWSSATVRVRCDRGWGALTRTQVPTESWNLRWMQRCETLIVLGMGRCLGVQQGEVGEVSPEYEDGILGVFFFVGGY